MEISMHMLGKGGDVQI